MIIDQAAREQVLDVRRSFLVQAPAGSGKTTLLVKRFLSLLAVVEKDPEEIIAITFTRKAAAEMRERILDALQDGADPIVQRALARDRQAGWNIINNPARLKIHTIDALCASIAGKLPIITRFGAEPQIAQHAELLYARAVDQLLQSEDRELNKLLLYLDNDRNKIKKLLITMLQIRDQWLPLLVRADFSEAFAASLEMLHSEVIEKTLENIPTDFVAHLVVDQDPTDYAEWLQVAQILLTNEGNWRKRLTTAEGFPAPSAAKNKLEKQQLQARKDAALGMLEQLQDAEEFRQNLHIIKMLPAANYTDEQWEILTALAQILKLLAAQLIVVFKNAGQVDHTEVSLAALHGLAQQDAIALAFDYKVSHILVDEFQDTSITQYALLENLVANWDNDGSKTLFLVGDPMQSIYRFRQAEVGLFLKAKEQGIGTLQLHYVQLQVNFRSTAPVVAWLNQVFEKSFPQHDDMTLGAITYRSAIAANAATTVNDKAVQFYNTTQEAAKIIEIIKRTPANKTIAILVRARSHLRDILPQLRAANIVYQGTDLESLFERPAVQDLLALTRALLHLDDRIAWLAILRAPWLALSLEHLQALAQYPGTIWQALQEAPIEPFCTIMADALALIGRETIDQIVKRTWRSLGGQACLRNVAELHECDDYFVFLMAHAHEQDIYQPYFLEERLVNIFTQPHTIEHAAVQVMTMHKAKGLEFDVVIIPGLTRQTRGDEQRLLLLERRDFANDYLLVAPIRAATEQQDKLYNYLAWCEKQRQNYESLRLLYVAATRAKEQIYCLAQINDAEPSSNCLLAAIWPAVCEDFPANKEQWSPRTAMRSIPPLRRLPLQWHQDHPYVPQVMVTTEVRIMRNTDWQRIVGTIVHRALWHLSQYGKEKMPDWRAYSQQLGLPQQYAHFITTAIQNILSCKYGETILARNYTESYAEWGLSIQNGLDAEQIIIDRAYLDHAGIFWIIDYKVVYKDSEIDLAIYQSQLSRYVAAVQKIKPTTQIKAGLYFPLQKKFEVMSVLGIATGA